MGKIFLNEKLVIGYKVENRKNSNKSEHFATLRVQPFFINDFLKFDENKMLIATN